MPDQLQMVYIVPAANGSIIAIAHYASEASEGFGKRFAYIMHTIEVLKLQLIKEWQSATLYSYNFFSYYLRISHMLT